MWKSLVSLGGALLFPPLCGLCDEALSPGESGLCTICLSELPETRHHVYRENPVWYALSAHAEIAFAATWLYFRQGEKVRKLLHRIKYKNGYLLAETVGRLYGEALALYPVWKNVDGIVPVPMHRRKLRVRGYNQAEAIARGISDALGVPVFPDLVIKRKHTRSQTTKSRELRMENTRSVFVVVSQEVVKGKSWLLVDDVITTGATLAELARILQEAGARQILACGLATAGA